MTLTPFRTVKGLSVLAIVKRVAMDPKGQWWIETRVAVHRVTEAEAMRVRSGRPF